MNNGKIVFITGISGYIGKKLATILNSKDEIKSIVGIDIREPDFKLSKLKFVKRDIRDPFGDILKEHNVDTVVHAAYILPPSHDKKGMEDININGTHNTLASVKDAGVKHLLYISSSTAYGFHADNDFPLTEDSPLRGNDDLTYSKNKKEIEFIMENFVEQNLDIDTTILRVAMVTGPGFNNPIARYLEKSLVLLPNNTSPMQFVHEDDLINIIYLLLVNRKPGIFNVGSDGAVPFKDMVKLFGNSMISVPFFLLYFLNTIAWNLRLTFVTETPSPGLNLMKYPWVVDSKKLKKAIGFTYRYSSLEAFKDFVNSRKI